MIERWNPSKTGADEVINHSTEDTKILSFLDRVLERNGPNSAAYISLGSYTWLDGRPEIIINIIQSLLDMEPVMPFVMKLPFDPQNSTQRDHGIPDDLIRQVETSGKGIFASWIPQVKVLEHEATGVFLVGLFLDFRPGRGGDSGSLILDQLSHIAGSLRSWKVSWQAYR